MKIPIGTQTTWKNFHRCSSTLLKPRGVNTHFISLWRHHYTSPQRVWIQCDFFFLLWHPRWPCRLYITSWTYLKVLRYCLPHSCHLLLVEWMSSLLTPVWAMHALLMLKFSWHYNRHPNTIGILQLELCDKTLFASRVERQFENETLSRHYIIWKVQSTLVSSEHLKTKLGGSLCYFIKYLLTFYFQIIFNWLQSYRWQIRICKVLALTKSCSLVE